MTRAIVVRRAGAPVVLAQGSALLSSMTGQAKRSRDQAQSAAAAALAAAGIGEFASTGLGLAGTAEGETFWVDQGNGIGQAYRHDAGPVATPLQSFLIDPAGSGAADALGAVGGSIEERLTTADDGVAAAGAGIERIDNIAPAATDAQWVPVAEPAASTYFATAGTGGDDANDLYALWEAFRAAHPTRITRTQFGDDESGTYPLWVYTIAPVRESRRKILINCGTHGGEITGMLGVLRAMMQFLGDDARKDERVRWLNDYCTVMVVPVLNPWGLSQSPRDRNNVNFVDINRNGDFKWDAFVNEVTPGYGTKGTSAFSEAETAALRDLVEDHPDLYRMADIHGFISHSGTADSLCYQPVYYQKSNRKGWRSFLRTFSGPGKEVKSQDTPEYPSLSNSFATRGVECVTPEYVPLATGSVYDAADMTRNVRFHGNFILELAFGAAPNSIDETQPVGKYFFLTGKSSPLPTNETDGTSTYAQHEFVAPCAGMLFFWGDVTYQGPTNTAVRFYVDPNIGQDAAIPSQFRQSSGSFNGLRSVDVPAISGVQARATVPFNTAMPIREGETVRVGVKCWASVGTNSSIAGGGWSLMFIPTVVGGNGFMAFMPHTISGSWTERAPNVLPLNS